MASNKYGKVGSGAKVHAFRVSADNGKTYPAVCGAGENHIGTRKRSPIHVMQDADASCVTCTKCQAILDSDNTDTNEQRVYQVGDTVTLNKNGKQGTIRYVKSAQSKPYGVFLHQSGSTHYYAVADFSPDPEPTSAPVADDPALTTHQKLVAIIFGETSPQFVDAMTPADPADTVAVKPVSGAQWLTRDDLKFAQFRDTSPLQSAWWGEWYFRQTFAYNAPVTVANKPSRVLKPRKVSSTMNMQKTAEFKNTRRAMTARQLGRLLKASPISRKPKPRSPLQIQRDLMFLDWIAGGQSPVQIVSRIETPLTGSVRRIA